MTAQSPLTLDHLNAFSEWVEGPSLFLDVRGRSREEVAEILEGFEAAGLLHDGNVPDDYRGVHMSLFPAKSRAEIVIFNDISDLTTQENGAAKAWLEVSEESLPMLATLSRTLVHGVVIQGGGEEQIGMKDYDAIDRIVEAAWDFASK